MEKYKKQSVENFEEFKLNYENGVCTIRLTSWNEFLDIAKKFHDYKHYFWRGQENDWQLKSSFDRNSFTSRLSYALGRQQALDVLLEKFKKRLHEVLKESFVNDEKEIWAIGQHHGLPTPLLDWTTDPFRAAYFATYKRGIDKGCRTVYALNMAIKRRKLGYSRFVEFLDIEKSTDGIQNDRLKAQKGRFTKSLNGIDIENNILKYASRQPDIILNKKILLMKIFIPSILQEECLRYLESKDITHGLLFPDYAGAVDICKVDLNIKEN